MTKQEAISWLSKPHHTCQHLNKGDVVYQGRIYTICKACLATTVMAMQKVGGLQGRDAEIAYSVYESDSGYQPEIFHVTELLTYWKGPWSPTKQQAYEAAQTQLITMFRPAQKA